MLKIMLTLLHCAQHYAHLQCKKSYYQTVAYNGMVFSFHLYYAMLQGRLDSVEWNGGLE